MDESIHALARRIGDRERHRDEAVRGVAVAGDYAAGRAWEASVLQIVLFRRAEAGTVDLGALREEEGVRLAVDRLPIGLLTGPDGLPEDAALTEMLASLELLRVTDAGLQEVLLLVRDRHHSAEGRAGRFERCIRAAQVALDDFGSTGLAIQAMEAAGLHAARALAARMGEPHDGPRLPRRLRAWGRVLKQTELASAFASAAGIDGRTPESARAALAGLRSLAEAHLDARMPEAGAALLPRIERICEPALAGAGALESRGDATGAVWALMHGALELDLLIDAASPWRERADYRARAEAMFGTPDLEMGKAFARMARDAGS